MSPRPIPLIWHPELSPNRAGAMAPATAATPATAWSYGPLSQTFPSRSESAWFCLELEPLGGVVGLSLVTPNGGELLTQEAVLRPGQGRRTVCLAHTTDMGEARLLFRNYGEEGVAGAVRIWAAGIGAGDDIPAGAERLDRSCGVLPEPSAEILACAAYAGETLIPISLGNSCETKFQIARMLHERRTGRPAGAAFRLEMLPPLRARDRFGWQLFDWRGTPLVALIALLERDFAGAFDRGDFVPQGRDVLNARLGTTHLHEFESVLEPGCDTFAQADIDRGFDNAKLEFDRLAQEFREHLKTPGPYLYIHACEDVPSAWSTFTLLKLLSDISPQHRFRLLFIGHSDSDNDLSSLVPLVDKHFRPRTNSKPQARQWEGSDEAWNSALSGYRLAFPDGALAEPGRKRVGA